MADEKKQENKTELHLESPGASALYSAALKNSPISVVQGETPTYQNASTPSGDDYKLLFSDPKSANYISESLYGPNGAQSLVEGWQAGTSPTERQKYDLYDAVGGLVLSTIGDNRSISDQDIMNMIDQEYANIMYGQEAHEDGSENKQDRISELANESSKMRDKRLKAENTPIGMIGDAWDSAMTGLGGIVDSAWDAGVGGIAEGFGGQAAKDAVTNLMDAEGAGNAVNGLIQMGMMMNPFSAAALGAASAARNLDEGITDNFDNLGLTKTDEQRARDNAWRAADTILTAAPGANFLQKGAKIALGERALANADDAVRAAYRGTNVLNGDETLNAVQAALRNVGAESTDAAARQAANRAFTRMGESDAGRAATQELNALNQRLQGEVSDFAANQATRRAGIENSLRQSMRHANDESIARMMAQGDRQRAANLARRQANARNEFSHQANTRMAEVAEPELRNLVYGANDAIPRIGRGGQAATAAEQPRGIRGALQGLFGRRGANAAENAAGAAQEAAQNATTYNANRVVNNAMDNATVADIFSGSPLEWLAAAADRSQAAQIVRETMAARATDAARRAANPFATGVLDTTQPLTRAANAREMAQRSIDNLGGALENVIKGAPINNTFLSNVVAPTAENIAALSLAAGSEYGANGLPGLLMDENVSDGERLAILASLMFPRRTPGGSNIAWRNTTSPLSSAGIRYQVPSSLIANAGADSADIWAGQVGDEDRKAGNKGIAGAIRRASGKSEKDEEKEE